MKVEEKEEKNYQSIMKIGVRENVMGEKGFVVEEEVKTAQFPTDGDILKYILQFDQQQQQKGQTQ